MIRSASARPGGACFPEKKFEFILSYKIKGMGLLAGNGIDHNQLTTTQGGAQMGTSTGGQQSSEVANLKPTKSRFFISQDCLCRL